MLLLPPLRLFSPSPSSLSSPSLLPRRRARGGAKVAGERLLLPSSHTHGAAPPPSFPPPARHRPLLLPPRFGPRRRGGPLPSRASSPPPPLPGLSESREPAGRPSPARGRSRAWPWRAAGMAAAARATRGHGWSGHASCRRAAVLLGALPACASTPAPGYSPPLPRPRHGAAVAAVSGTAADGLPFSAPSRWPAARAPSSLPPSARAGHGELRRARTAAAVPASSAGGRSSACMRRGCGGDESDVWVPHVSGSRERARNRSQGYYCPFVFQFNCSVSIFDTNGIEGMEN